MIDYSHYFGTCELRLCFFLNVLADDGVFLVDFHHSCSVREEFLCHKIWFLLRNGLMVWKSTMLNPTTAPCFGWKSPRIFGRVFLVPKNTTACLVQQAFFATSATSWCMCHCYIHSLSVDKTKKSLGLQPK